MELGNLVVLEYALGTLKVQAVGIKEHLGRTPQFSVDTEKGTWSYLSWQNLPIGQSRPIADFKAEDLAKHRIIGVYNLDENGHTGSFAHDFRRLGSLDSAEYL